MRAAVLHAPRDLRIETVPDPTEPGDDDVVLAVRRVALCGTDAAEWDHGPRMTGGRVEVFAVGQRVVSGAGVWCGICEWCTAGRTNLCASYYTHGLTVDGGLADFVRVPAKTLVAVPDSVSDDAAALAQPLAVALHALRRSGARPGDACVVIGVGGIGAFIVAAAAARGISTLIAVDVDADRLATAASLGATQTIDASSIDLAAALRDVTGGLGAHVVIEASGAPLAPASALAATRKGGRVLLVGLQAAPRELDLFMPTVREIDIMTTLAHVCQQDMPESVAILATTNVAAATLERTIGLGDLVPLGLVPLRDRTATGKIVVDPGRP
jgi:(R,R)-butanediol dehydrogenase / meso-butanediol dehydrogenase / diacetyl reductase